MRGSDAAGPGDFVDRPTNPPAAVAQTILVVEDDAKITNLLRLYLEREGYRVVAVSDGEAALDVADRTVPSLIILDLLLPRLDGIEVCRRLRAKSDVPILMLTARVDEVDKLLGLSLGADDYVTKPFSPREVVARVKAVLRRSERRKPDRVLHHKGLTMDFERHRVTLDGRELELTPIEFKILRTFLEAPERAFSREQLLNSVYPNEEADVIDRTVDVHVGRLRAKLGDDPVRPRFIATVRGVGYRLR